jgi:ABC-type transporter MlaC component
MYNRRMILIGLAGAALTTQAGTCFAANPAAENHVRIVSLEVMKLANSGLAPLAMRTKFAQLLGKYVNIKGVANFALGPNVKRLKASERDEFYDLVENYAAALFAWYAKDFKGNEFEIVSSSTQGRWLTIQSAIKGSGNGLGGTQIKWRLSGSGNSFRIEDVLVKNVWMAIAMKKRFGDILNRSKGDFAPLFAELRAADNWWS